MAAYLGPHRSQIPGILIAMALPALELPGDDDMELDAAASKIQAVHRGRAARRAVKQKSKASRLPKTRDERQTEQVTKIIRDMIAANRTAFGHKLDSIETMFGLIDHNGDGRVDAAEFADCLKRLGLGLSDKQLQQLLGVMDEDNDGKIDYGEFLVAIRPPAKRRQPSPTDERQPRPPPRPNPSATAARRVAEPPKTFDKFASDVQEALSVLRSTATARHTQSARTHAVRAVFESPASRVRLSREVLQELGASTSRQWPEQLSQRSTTRPTTSPRMSLLGGSGPAPPRYGTPRYGDRCACCAPFRASPPPRGTWGCIAGTHQGPWTHSQIRLQGAHLWRAFSLPFLRRARKISSKQRVCTQPQNAQCALPSRSGGRPLW